MARITKKDIYKEYGIKFEKVSRTAWHIFTPIGHMPPVLVKGNEKIGNVWHFSTLPGTHDFSVTLANGTKTEITGTCGQDCVGGYCGTGHYKRRQSVKNSLANKTVLAREYMDFLNNAIRAQIVADHIGKVRIHVTGDFFNREYLNMWVNIVNDFPGVTFWTYTKERACETAFDRFPNANIVKSDIENIGYNYGHADYIIAIYNMLKDMGKDVYICRCGMDPKQHCDKCAACAKCEYVLFLEHGTDYNSNNDPAFPAFVQLVESQGNKYLN